MSSRLPEVDPSKMSASARQQNPHGDILSISIGQIDPGKFTIELNPDVKELITNRQWGHEISPQLRQLIRQSFSELPNELGSKRFLLVASTFNVSTSSVRRIVTEVSDIPTMDMYSYGEGARLVSQVSNVIETGNVPDNWNRKTSVNLKTVYSIGNFFVALYDITVPHSRTYNQVEVPELFTREARYEAASLVEHLMLLGREDDAKAVKLIESQERIAMITPRLGEDAFELVEDWVSRGMPKGEEPMTAQQFYKLCSVLLQSTYLSSDTGLFDLLIHNKKGPVLIDRTSQFGAYEDIERMRFNLLLIADQFSIAYDDLHQFLRNGISLDQWAKRLRETRAEAVHCTLERALSKPGWWHHFKNLGVHQVAYATDGKVSLIEGEGEFFIYLDLRKVARGPNVFKTTIKGIKGDFAQWGEDTEEICIHYNRPIDPKERSNLLNRLKASNKIHI